MATATVQKRCPRCSTIKDSIIGFATDKAAKDGRSGWCRACRNEWAKANRDITGPVDHAYRIRTRYGITIEQYTDLLNQQGNCCAICGSVKPKGNGGKRFHVDHDHDSGRIRGLLCSPCNSGLGHFGDDPDRIRLALKYLEST